MSELFAAALGALLAGAFQLFDRIAERSRRRESTLVAIVSEVRAICDLMKHQQYLEHVAAAAAEIRAGTWKGMGLVIDIRGNYFSVFEALAPDLGLLTPNHVAKIVAFYAYCKSAIDSTRPDGPHVAAFDQQGRAENILSLEGTLAAILALGEEIVGLPKQPLSEVLAHD